MMDQQQETEQQRQMQAAVDAIPKVSGRKALIASNCKPETFDYPWTTTGCSHEGTYLQRNCDFEIAGYRCGLQLIGYRCRPCDDAKPAACRIHLPYAIDKMIQGNKNDYITLGTSTGRAVRINATGQEGHQTFLHDRGGVNYRHYSCMEEGCDEPAFGSRHDRHGVTIRIPTGVTGGMEGVNLLFCCDHNTLTVRCEHGLTDQLPHTCGCWPEQISDEENYAPKEMPLKVSEYASGFVATTSLAVELDAEELDAVEHVLFHNAYPDPESENAFPDCLPGNIELGPWGQSPAFYRGLREQLSKEKELKRAHDALDALRLTGAIPEHLLYP